MPSRYYDDDFDIEKGPQIGDGATQSVGSDSYPYTVVSVSNERVRHLFKTPDMSQAVEVMWPKWIEVTSDNYKGISGEFHQGNVVYEYTSDFGRSATRYILKDGRYRQATRKWDPATRKDRILNSTTQNAQSIAVGFRRFYNNPSF